VDLKEMGCEAVNWILLPQGRAKCQILVKRE